MTGRGMMMVNLIRNLQQTEDIVHHDENKAPLSSVKDSSTEQNDSIGISSSRKPSIELHYENTSYIQPESNKEKDLFSSPSEANIHTADVSGKEVECSNSSGGSQQGHSVNQGPSVEGLSLFTNDDVLSHELQLFEANFNECVVNGVGYDIQNLNGEHDNVPEEDSGRVIQTDLDLNISEIPMISVINGLSYEIADNNGERENVPEEDSGRVILTDLDLNISEIPMISVINGVSYEIANDKGERENVPEEDSGRVILTDLDLNVSEIPIISEINGVSYEISNDNDENVRENVLEEDSGGVIQTDKKKLSRKRFADEENWARNSRKKKRMSGQPYVTQKGKIMPGKSFVGQEQCNCRFKCASHISLLQQQCLFDEYWKVGDACRQKSYVSSLIIEQPVTRKRKRIDRITKKEKLNSRFYELPDENQKNHRVCRQLFCKLFQISTCVICITNLALKKKSLSGVFLAEDGRKGRPAPNATKVEEVEHVKKHIDSFPRMESHYCRKDSKKLYLSPELNVAELYRLYVNDYCKTENINPVKDGVFRTIFKSYDPPLTTYVPKKDQCTKCNRYRDADDKSTFGKDYETHVRRKKEAMEMKKIDMNTKEKNEVTATFDLQAVLMLPFAGDCQIYYRRKLSVYNFTIYDSNSDGYCYLWDESNGMKGSSEIGTGLVTYMTKLPSYVNHVTTYSDTCGGQNRNQFVASAMLFVVNKTHIETVDMKYMESGHSYLEADSMHSTIERARKHKKVFTTEEWGLLIEMSRKKPKPYQVKIQSFNDIYDLTKLGQLVMYNRTVNVNGDTVNWLKIKWLRFEKSKPFIIQYKYELQNQLAFEELDTRMNCKQTLTWDMVDLPKKYSTNVPISKAKKKDLLYLLKEGVIHTVYTEFYSRLPMSDKANDVAPYVQDEEDEELISSNKGSKRKKTEKAKTPGNGEHVRKTGSTQTLKATKDKKIISKPMENDEQNRKGERMKTRTTKTMKESHEVIFVDKRHDQGDKRKRGAPSCSKKTY